MDRTVSEWIVRGNREILKIFGELEKVLAVRDSFGLVLFVEAHLQQHLAEFLARMTQRLEEGARVYGGASLRAPSSTLLTEIQQELEDVAGWSVLLWSRLEHLRAGLEDDGA